MQCTSCSAQIPDNSKFCIECGTPVQRVCPSCGTANNPAAKFCAECGTQLGAASSAPPSVLASQPGSQQQLGDSGGGVSGGAAAGGAAFGAGTPATADASAPAAGVGAADDATRGLMVPDAERRRMTVLFCDMVGSTQMSTVVDPEDLRDVISAYIEAAEGVIEKYGGHVANYLGDGVLAYFGYPRAHEDDARRACLAGLGIVAAVPELSERLQAQFDVTLAVRVGVHTGTTVIGTVGGGESPEVMAVGETLNLASRLQDTAEHNTVVISETTARLVDGYFEWTPLGPRTFKGVDAPVDVYEIVRSSGVVDRVAAAEEGLLGPLVGRDSELQALAGRWSDSEGGNGRVVTLRGGPGIGKSRLVRALQVQIEDQEHEWLSCRCSEYHADSPLHPVIEMGPKLWGFAYDDEPEVKVAHIEARLTTLGLDLSATTPLLCALLDLPAPAGYPPLALAPQVQRERTLDVLAEAVARLSRSQPVVLVVEDMQWVDQTTLEWLHRLADRRHGAAMLVLLSGRQELEAPIDIDSEVVLRRLPPDEVQQVIRNVTGGKELPASVVDQIISRADGNPLYVEELTKTALESGELIEGDDSYRSARPAEEMSIPASLQESLMARLDRIAPAKIVVQLGATIGRTFPFALVRDVLRMDSDRVVAELDQLMEAGILYRRGVPPSATYAFRQTLVRDAAYSSMTRKTRRHYHAQIARAISEGEFETEPEVLAHHFTEAGDASAAVASWQLAGQAALGSFALAESINHLRRGLAVLDRVPDTPDRIDTELGLRVTLGVPLMLTQGFASPEVAGHYGDLLELCDRAGGAEAHLFPALYGLWTFHEVSAQYAEAEDMGQRLLQLGERVGDSGIQLGAHVAYGAARLMRGDLATARQHLESGLALYDPNVHPELAMLFGQDGGAMCASFLTWVHAHDGDRDQAMIRAEQSLRMSQDLGQPSTDSFVKAVLASYHCVVGEYESAATYAREVVALGEEHMMPHWAAQGELNLGWALQGLGEPDEASEVFQRALMVWDAIGTRAATSYFRGAQVETELKRGNVDEADAILTGVFAFVEESDERYYEPELHRLKAEVALAAGGAGAADAGASSLRTALEIAESQGANGLAKRAEERLAEIGT